MLCVYLCLFDWFTSCLQCGEKEHTLVHYWYTAWPDHKAPNTARQLLDLVKTVQTQKQQLLEKPEQAKGPVVVHCRSVR